LPIIKQVLIEHRVVIVLIVVFDKLFFFELSGIITDHGDIFADIHSEVVTTLHIRLFFFEKSPELYDLMRCIFKKPIQSLLHLRRLYK